MGCDDGMGNEFTRDFFTGKIRQTKLNGVELTPELLEKIESDFLVEEAMKTSSKGIVTTVGTRHEVRVNYGNSPERRTRYGFLETRALRWFDDPPRQIRVEQSWPTYASGLHFNTGSEGIYEKQDDLWVLIEGEGPCKDKFKESDTEFKFLEALLTKSRKDFTKWLKIEDGKLPEANWPDESGEYRSVQFYLNDKPFLLFKKRNCDMNYNFILRMFLRGMEVDFDFTFSDYPCLNGEGYDVCGMNYADVDSENKLISFRNRKWYYAYEQKVNINKNHLREINELNQEWMFRFYLKEKD